VINKHALDAVATHGIQPPVSPRDSRYCGLVRRQTTKPEAFNLTGCEGDRQPNAGVGMRTMEHSSWNQIDLPRYG